MGIKDSGADIVIELTNEYARTIFEEIFRSELVCVPDLAGITNPLNTSQKLTTKGLVPRLKKTALRQQTVGNIPKVFLDLTLEVAAGVLKVNDKPSNEITLPIEISLTVSGGKLSVQPSLPLVLSALIPLKSVELPLDLLATTDFSATPSKIAIKLVGSQKNLAIGIDVTLKGTLRQFSGECPKSDASIKNANLGGPTSDLSKFRNNYNTALLSATDYYAVAVVVDENVLGAMIKTVGTDKKGTLIGTRLWLDSAGPGQLIVMGQGCAHHSSCAGDWWDSGWKANAKLLVQGKKVVISYQVIDAYLTDTDSGWDTCVDATSELQKRGVDKGVQDIGISAKLTDKKETGLIEISSIDHRKNDAVFSCTSTLSATSGAYLTVDNEVAFATTCGGGQSVPAEKLTLLNSGWSPLHVCYLKLTGKDAKAFKVETTKSQFTLKHNEQTSVTVKLVGAVGNNYKANLLIGSNSGLDTVSLLALTEGAAMSHPIAVSLIGKSKMNLCTGGFYDRLSKDIELKNTGKGTLRICSLNIEGANSKLFSVGFPSALTQLPQVVKPGDSLTLRAEFMPSKKELNKQYSATLKIGSNLATASIGLIGKLERPYDGKSGGASWSFSKSLVCGKLLYEPPMTSVIPHDLISQFLERLKGLGGKPPWEDKALLFLDLQIQEAPRQLRLDVIGQEGTTLATAENRFHTKLLVFPYVEGQTGEIRLTSATPSDTGASELNFRLHNWMYEPISQLSADSQINDFAVAEGSLFAVTNSHLLMADLDAAGTVQQSAALDEWAGAQALTTVGHHLIIAKDGCHVLDISTPGQLDKVASIGVCDLAGLYSPDRQLHHVDRELGGMVKRAGLFYGLGERLHVIAIGNGQGHAELSDVDIPRPVSRALAWGTRLYAVGDHNVYRFDISDPWSPQLTGSFSCDHRIKTFFVFGCLAVLGHEGPSATLLDLTYSDRLEQAGSYAAHPEISNLFPSHGPIFMDGRFVYSLNGSGQELVVGRLASLVIGEEPVEQLHDEPGE